MKKLFSAGGIIFNKKGQVLLTQHSQNKHWSFPKGEPEGDESMKQAALREVKEEGGVEAEIMYKLGEEKLFYTLNKEKIFKTVTLYLMRHLSGDPEDHGWEVSEALWLAPEEAMGKLDFKNDKELLQKALDIMVTEREFVSRGGIKLQEALYKFNIDVKDKLVLDIGSSTGGFTDCLLQNGAKKVFAVDTCYGELAWKLRNDPRVVVMERTNALHIQAMPEMVDVITIDAGWTKLEIIIPAVRKFLMDNGVIIALLKTQYQAGRNTLKKGLVPEDLVPIVKSRVITRLNQLGYKIKKCIESPIKGGAGNTEFLLKITL